MNRRKLIGVVASLLVAALGTFVIVNYVQSSTSDEPVAKAEPTSNVLIVVKPVAPGTAAEALGDAVQLRPVPQSVKVPDAVSKVDDLKGLVSAVDLVPGEQLIRTRFVTPQAKSRGEVAPDMLTQTVSLSPERALGGRIEPGYTVAIMTTLKSEGVFPNQTHVLLRKVPIVAVQSRTDVKKVVDGATSIQPAPDGDLLVTFAVSPSDSQKLTYAAENGSLWLTNEPADAPDNGTPVITRDNIFQ